MAAALGIGEGEAKKAFDLAYEKQMECFAKFTELGRQALAEARLAERPVIALLGRPYNSFTADANMGIPGNTPPGDIPSFPSTFFRSR
jgi:predicted nucleotide-binding protein (sugar kinase/HSP70/actin superfamily)